MVSKAKREQDLPVVQIKPREKGQTQILWITLENRRWPLSWKDLFMSCVWKIYVVTLDSTGLLSKLWIVSRTDKTTVILNCQIGPATTGHAIDAGQTLSEWSLEPAASHWTCFLSLCPPSKQVFLLRFGSLRSSHSLSCSSDTLRTEKDRTLGHFRNVSSLDRVQVKCVWMWFPKIIH